jgi:UDP-N-acetylglucosamine 4,6-dehydratase
METLPLTNGLREGEKLHEELMLGDSVVPTEDPRIFKVQEPFLPPDELTRVMAKLWTAIEAGAVSAIHSVLAEAMEGHRRGRSGCVL